MTIYYVTDTKLIAFSVSVQAPIKIEHLIFCKVVLFFLWNFFSTSKFCKVFQRSCEIHKIFKKLRKLRYWMYPFGRKSHCNNKNMEISTTFHILVWLVSNSYRVSRVMCQYQLRKHRNWRQKYTIQKRFHSLAKIVRKLSKLSCFLTPLPNIRLFLSLRLITKAWFLFVY